ncbi:MAG TPA: hypothetical protein VE033_02520 [Acetobacteraceae bacterium]|nr:hypothetical protein [Acetobacteraceae bacterium]
MATVISEAAHKLGWRPGMSAAVLGAPAGFDLGIPTRATAAADLILAFATDRAALRAVAPRALNLYGIGGRLWIAYPKKGGSIRSDLDRDHGWEPVTSEGLLPVTQVALDATWSALRFRFREEIPKVMRAGAV